MSERQYREYEAAVKELVDTLSRDFGVEAPDVELVSMYVFRRLGLFGSTSYYHGYFKYMALHRTLRPSEMLDAILHEFAHHLQNVRGMKVDESEYDKPHCQRTHEREAKNFATEHYKSYEEVWKDILRRHGVKYK